MDSLIEAQLIFNDHFIGSLIRPQLYEKKGRIYIKCLIGNDILDFSDNHFSLKQFPNIKFSNSAFTIQATKGASRIEFIDVRLKRGSYPDFQFIFVCLSHSLEYANVWKENVINCSELSHFTIEGAKIQYSQTSTITREREVFNINDTHILSFELDTIEVPLNLWFKKRHYDLKIAVIKHPSKSRCIVIKFYGESFLSYRVYNKIKYSITYFISYLLGNNIIIREEIFSNNSHGYFIKKYSYLKDKMIRHNEYLPMYDVQFRSENILEKYSETISLYLFLDKKIKLSEIVYLINQSKKVNIDSGFFILLICIEKLSRLLLVSDLIPSSDKTVVSKKLFDQIKVPLFKRFEELCNDSISKNDMLIFKAKINNLNIKGKTDYKIDLLLDFTEIERTDEVSLLFPYLRNLAIHEGEISSTGEDHYNNYLSLFNLVNEIICNLIQYKGIRKPKLTTQSWKTYIKTEYNKNYKSEIGYINHQ